MHNNTHPIVNTKTLKFSQTPLISLLRFPFWHKRIWAANERQKTPKYVLISRILHLPLYLHVWIPYMLFYTNTPNIRFNFKQWIGNIIHIWYTRRIVKMQMWMTFGVKCDKYIKHDVVQWNYITTKNSDWSILEPCVIVFVFRRQLNPIYSWS